MSGTHADPQGEDHERDPAPPMAVVFDVNETLSDMSPLAQRFAEVGAAEDMAATWFASLLRDGFALTSAGVNPSFADIARDLLIGQLTGQVTDPEGGAEQIMAAFAELSTHPDVAPGIRDLVGLGFACSH
ncbi:MAG: hypothetical protein ABR500_08945 [Dermatophilaceae bacterium]|nr:hypothetical protein [Intrasporangiaceae bacterium]